MKTFTVSPEKIPPFNFIQEVAYDLGYKTKINLMSEQTMGEVIMIAGIRWACRSLKPLERAKVIIPKTKITFIVQKDEKGSIRFDCEALRKTLGIEGQEHDEEIASIISSCQKIPDGEPFTHPLTEVDNDYMNMWGFGSMVVNAILNPEITGDGGRKAKDNARKLLLSFDPFCDCDRLFEKIESRNLASCLEAANKIKEAAELLARKQNN